MIHQYKSNGYNIVMDVNSGSVHAVDELAYDVISLYQSESEDSIVAHMLDKYRACPDITEAEIRETLSDIAQLKADGKLFSEDIYENLAIDFKKRQSVLKAICLHVAHDCNMACRYCFAGAGEYAGDRELMSYEVGKRAFDYLIEHSGKRRHLEVDFFGGEPLMNFQVVKQLVEYGHQLEKEHDKQFRFTLTTNGMLLNDEIAEYLNREMGNVVLSLDGRREVHDRMRPTRGGNGTYDLILPKFKALVDNRQGEYYIRGTYTHHNLDFADDILHMADLGFDQLSIEPVVAPPEAPYALQQADLPQLLDQYDRLAVEMIRRKKAGKGFTFYHFMIDLTGGPCIVKRISGCGVGAEYLAVTPQGDLYPCHQFVGNPEFRLGSVFEGITNADLRDEFKLCNMYAKEKCRDCFAKFFCSGGCAANSYNFGGNINGTYEIGCALQRKRVECAVMMKVDEAMVEPDADITVSE